MTPSSRPGIGSDIKRPGPRPRPARSAPLTPPAPVLKPAPSATTIRPQRRVWRWLFEAVQYPLIGAVALGAAYSPAIGQWLVLSYAVAVLMLRRSSRLTFAVALFILVTIPLFEALGQSGISQNAAIYVYELLLLGTVQAIWEQRKIAKTHK